MTAFFNMGFSLLRGLEFFVKYRDEKRSCVFSDTVATDIQLNKDSDRSEKYNSL